MDLLVLFGTMVIFFAIGVPIGICLIFPCFLLLLVNPVTSASFLAQSFYTGVASSSMIALPFFMICGKYISFFLNTKYIVCANTQLFSFNWELTVEPGYNQEMILCRVGFYVFFIIFV